MIKSKNDRIFYSIYALLFVSLSGVFIFEIPRAVFWSASILFGLFLLYFIFYKKSFSVPAASVPLIVFGFTYVLFTYEADHSIYYQSYIFLHLLFMFIIGYNFYPREDPFDQRSKRLDSYILIVAVMFIIYVCVTYAIFLKDPSAAPEPRKYWSVWYPGLVKKTATGFCASMMFAVGWGIYSFFFSKNRIKKIIGPILVVICFVFNIITETRLLVFLVPVMIFAEFIAWLVIRRNKKKTGLIITVVFVLSAIIVITIYSVFKNEISALLANSVFSRFADLGFRSTRWKYAANVLKNFSFTYLGGGFNSASVGVPHNFWLYVYDYGGIIPFVSYCVFTVMTVVSYFRFIKNKSIPVDLKVFITTLCVPVVTELMFEDLLYGLPSFVLIAHFIFGVFSGLAKYKPQNI